MITKFIWNIAQFEVTEMIWCIALGLGAWSEVRVSDRVLGFGFAVDGDMGLCIGPSGFSGLAFYYITIEG